MGGKGKSKTKVKVTLDPTQQALNRIRLEQEQARRPLQDLSIQNLMQFLQPEFSLPEGFTVPEGLPGFGDLKFSTPEQAFAASRFAALTDISKLLDVGRQHFETVGAPSIRAGLTAGGLGRSGAVGEALQRGAASLSLPLTLEGRRSQEALANLINSFSDRRTDLASQHSLPTAPTFSGGSTTTTTKGGGFNPFNLIAPLASSFLGGFGSLFGSLFPGMAAGIAGIGSPGGLFGSPLNLGGGFY